MGKLCPSISRGRHVRCLCYCLKELGIWKLASAKLFGMDWNPFWFKGSTLYFCYIINFVPFEEKYVL